MTFLDPGSESRIGNRRAVNWLYRAANLLGFWKIVDRKIADFGFILQIIGSVHAAGAFGQSLAADGAPALFEHLPEIFGIGRGGIVHVVFTTSNSKCSSLPRKIVDR
jgi:hypothetical protein